jgi:hypothetical protein
MRNRILARAVVILVLAVATAAAPAIFSKDRSGAEGVWKVKITPDADATAKGEKESDDTLVLKSGKFHSTGCDPYGFGPASYKVEGNHFMADTESKKEGKIHWHGEVSGATVSGQMTWTKTDGNVMNYTFSGTRTGEPPAAGSGKKSKG